MPSSRSILSKREGSSNHIHLLATLNPTISLSDFVKQVKNFPSHFINHEIQPDFLFKWQGSYGAVTVSEGDIDRLCEYIDRQEEHHRQKSLIPDWEETYPSSVTLREVK